MQKEIKKLELFLTEDCNLRCDYCYISKRKSNMTWEIAKKAIDLHFQDFNQNDWYIFELFGGEPLLRFDLIKKIVTYTKKIAEKHNLQVTYRMVNNGTLINAEFIQFLRENLNYFIQISCDGIKAAHDLHRKNVAGQGTFDLIEKNIKKLAEENPQNRKTDIHAVVAPDNVKYLYESYQYFAQYPANQFVFHYNFSQVSDWKKEDFEEYQKQNFLIVEAEKEKLKRNEQCRDQVIFRMIKQIETKGNEKYVCQAGRAKGMTVDSKGDIFLCHRFESLKRDRKFKEKMADFYLGNVLESESLDWAKWNEKRGKLRFLMQDNVYTECQKCKNKKYCHWGKCVWNNYYLNGDFEKLNTNICKTLAHFLPPVLEFHKWLEKENLIDRYLESFEGRAR